MSLESPRERATWKGDALPRKVPAPLRVDVRNAVTDMSQTGRAKIEGPPVQNPPSGRFNRFLSHFSRVTSSGRFIPEIDGLRFVAIVTVVMLHLGTHLKRIRGLEQNPIAD